MTKKTIFMTAGTFVLAVVAFFSTSAHKKFFSGAATAYYKVGSSFITLFKGASSATVNLTTKAAGGLTTAFYASQKSASHTYTLFSKTSGSGHTLFFK